MFYDRKQARKAERQRKQMAQTKRIRIEKAAPALLEACKVAVLAMTHEPINPKDVAFVKQAIEQAEG